MASLSIPASLSPDITKVFRQMDRAFVGTTPKYPVSLPSYSTTGAGLPKATDYPFSMIWVADHNTVAISNGTSWHTLSLGSAL